MVEQCQCCGTEIRKYKGTFISGPNYTISQDNRSVTKYSGDGWNANAIGSEEITPGTITIINFKIENTTSNSNIMFGIAPKSVNQSSKVFNSCGWYFYSNSGGLYCQSPLSYSNFEYRNDRQLPNNTIITIIVDTISGKISYKINNDNIKTAYHSITFNESIVPCVNLFSKGDAVRILQS